MSDRLGLEPLRTLSDSMKVAAANAKMNQTTKKPEIKTKPILKYRSLSDILMPSATTSPTLEDELNFDDQSTISVHHARSDSHLVRLNSLNKHRKKRGSPITSPRSTSPERAAHSDSSSASVPVKKEHRHISFNHRVEQCIAVDSTEEARRYPTAGGGRPSADSDDDEEGSDDDQVLTFKSSPRVATFGPSALSNANEWEPHTIARLGPTTLKSVELYPAPSPAVVYQNYSGTSKSTSGPDGSYGQPTPTYSTKPPTSENEEAAPSLQPGGKRPPYDYSKVAAAIRTNGWDPEDDDDYAMGFDYYNGPEVGVGDEYDTASYGSTHLVGGTHNDFQSGAPSYLGPGSSYGPHTTGGINSSSTESSPNHSRRSSNNSSTGSASPSSYGSPNTTSIASAGVRGPHAPTASKESGTPKRSILKGGVPATGSSSSRSRENSVESNLSTSSSSLSTSPRDPASSSSPLHSPSLSSSHSSSSPSVSPYGSAIPPHVRPNIGGRRGSDDGAREARGRSASRGSSSSLERAASADRRSSTSISPSSYSPPNPSMVGPGGVQVASGVGGVKPGLIQQSRRVGSHESLSGAAHTIASRSSSMGNVPEASSESESETVTGEGDGEGDEPAVPTKGLNGTAAVIGPRSTSFGQGAEVEEVEDVSIPATVSDTDDSAPSSEVTTPKVS